MKVIILLLDCFNTEIVEKCKENMPNLYRHWKENSSSILKTEFPNSSNVSMTSFQTGKKIANHGIYNYYKFDSDLNPHLITGADFSEKCFYEYIDEQGMKCFLMNLMYSYPPRIKGDIIFSWLTGTNDINKLVHPKSLIQKFSSIKNYRSFSDKAKSINKYLKDNYNVFLTQVDVIKEVITSQEYDFMHFHIMSTDAFQHKAFLDIIDGKKNKRVRITRRMLIQIDKLIGWVDKNRSEETTVFILSDHGFKEYKGEFFINSFLKKEGYLVTSTEGKILKDIVPMKKRNINLSKIIAFIKKYPFLFKLGEIFYGPLIRKLPFNIIKQPKIDLGYSKAYCLSQLDGIIYINKKVQGEGKIKLKKEIIQKLNRLEGIKVEDCDNHFKGKYRDKLGDLIVINEDYETDDLIGDSLYVKMRRGNHSSEGIFITYGKNIREKALIKEVNIYDIAPTILYSLGFSIPFDMDGRVLNEIFEKEIPTIRKIEFNKNMLGKESDLLNKAIRNIKI